MLRSFERADFCHSKAKICTEYEAISKIFNDAVAEICLSKPYGVRISSLCIQYNTAKAYLQYINVYKFDDFDKKNKKIKIFLFLLQQF